MAEITKENIGEALTQIWKGLKVSSDKEAMENPLYEHIEKNLQFFKDPEDFHLMCNYKFERIIENLVTAYFGKDDHLITDIYLHYEVYQRNITKVTEKMEGWACSVDRARFVLREVIKFRKTGVEPDFNKGEKDYWTPTKGTFQEWFKLVEGIYSFQYGHPLKYLEAFTELTRPNMT